MSCRNLVILLLLFCPNLAARVKFFSFCQQGGELVHTNSQPSSDKFQQSFPAATVNVYYTGGWSGSVTTDGTAVTLYAGQYPFNANSGWTGLTMTINSVSYVIESVNSTSSITLTSSAGTQSVPVTATMPSTAPAAIFSDNAGTVKSNPYTCDLTTAQQFMFADNGTYDFRFSGTGIASPFTISAISGIDPKTLNGQVSVLQFGAKCDGVTDDIAAFNAALLVSNVVNVPRGTCAVSGVVVLTTGKVLTGAGMGASIIFETTLPACGSTTNGKTPYDVVDITGSNAILRDITLKGPAGSAPSPCPSISYALGQKGLVVEPASSSTGNLIENVEIEQIQTNCAETWSGATYTTYRNVKFHDCGLEGHYNTTTAWGTTLDTVDCSVTNSWCFDSNEGRYWLLNYTCHDTGSSLMALFFDQGCAVWGPIDFVGNHTIYNSQIRMLGGRVTNSIAGGAVTIGMGTLVGTVITDFIIDGLQVDSQDLSKMEIAVNVTHGGGNLGSLLGFVFNNIQGSNTAMSLQNVAHGVISNSNFTQTLSDSSMTDGIVINAASAGDVKIADTVTIGWPQDGVNFQACSYCSTHHVTATGNAGYGIVAAAVTGSYTSDDDIVTGNTMGGLSETQATSFVHGLAGTNSSVVGGGGVVGNSVPQVPGSTLLGNQSNYFAAMFAGLFEGPGNGCNADGLFFGNSLSTGSMSLCNFGSFIKSTVQNGGSGTVTTSSSGNTLTYVSGDHFNTGWTGSISVNGSNFTLVSCTSTTACSVTANPGNHVGVPYAFDNFIDSPFEASAHAVGGTLFSVSGCATVSAKAGGSSAGSFATTTTGTCTAVITMGGVTATNGWECHGSDITNAATLIQTAESTTTCTLKGTTTSGDTLTFSATPF